MFYNNKKSNIYIYISLFFIFRQSRRTLFKSMDGFKKGSEKGFLSKLSQHIPPFSTERKTFSCISLIDIHVIDSAWLDEQEYFCQLSNDIEEIDDFLSSLFFFKTMKMLKLGLIIEVFMNERIGDENQMDDDDDDDIDYESKKYYGIMIPLSEYLGFIRIINKEANSAIQSYIRDSKKKNGKKNDDFLSKLTNDVNFFKKKY